MSDKKKKEKKHVKKVVVEPVFTTEYNYIVNEPTVICNLTVKRGLHQDKLFKGVVTCDATNSFDRGTGELMAALKAEKKMQAWAARKMKEFAEGMKSTMEYYMAESNHYYVLSNAARKTPPIPGREE